MANENKKSKKQKGSKLSPKAKELYREFRACLIRMGELASEVSRLSEKEQTILAKKLTKVANSLENADNTKGPINITPDDFPF